jgi:hypothetical protein
MRTAGKWTTAACALLLAGLVGVVPAAAGHNDDIHSDNIKKRGREPIRISEDNFAEGSDLAFQRRLLIAGTYQGTSLFRILQDAPYIRQISFHHCPSSQGDVSVWGTLAFVSIDSPSSNNGQSNVCNNTNNSQGKEGIRILDISDQQQPRQVGFVETDCGSHTHTLVPDGRKLFIYVLSYPLGAPTPSCNVATHRKISVIRVDKDNPAESEVVTTPDVSPAIGCHDVTVYPRENLAAAACITESQMWDISDRNNPTILAHINNPQIEVHHSSAFTWDADYAIFSDEHAGAAGGGGCSPDEESTVGAMWFYDVTDPSSPVLQGHHSLPRVPPVDSEDEAVNLRCTTHNYNILPMKNPDKYITVSAYYMGGLAAVDFSNPVDPNPTEIGHYLPVVGGKVPDMWSAYWYNGRIYSNEHNSQLGVSVFRMKKTGRIKVDYFEDRLNPQTQIPNFQ